MMQEKQLRAWRTEFAHVREHIADCFGRREPRERALVYLQGLLAPLERKNGWQLAEAAGARSPDGMQDFLHACIGMPMWYGMHISSMPSDVIGKSAPGSEVKPGCSTGFLRDAGKRNPPRCRQVE